MFKNLLAQLRDGTATPEVMAYAATVIENLMAYEGATKLPELPETDESFTPEIARQVIAIYTGIIKQAEAMSGILLKENDRLRDVAERYRTERDRHVAEKAVLKATIDHGGNNVG